MAHDLSIPKSLDVILSEEQRDLWMTAWDAISHYEQKIMQEDINKMGRWLNQPMSVDAAEDLGLKAEIGLILHSADKPFAWYISGLSEDGQQVYGVREDIYTHIGTILQRNLCDVVLEADLIFMGPDGKQLRDVFTHAAYADPIHKNAGRSVLRIGMENKMCTTASTRINPIISSRFLT